MKITIEKIDNPNQEFWIWDKKITNKDERGIYPSTTTNVGSGESVAVYKSDGDDNLTQIAQLQIPDYVKLLEHYTNGKQINLDYTYISDFTWLGNKKLCKIESLTYIELESFSAQCSIFNNDEEKGSISIIKSRIINGDVDFSYAGFFNIDLSLCDLLIEKGNLVFSYAHFHYADIYFGMITCAGNQLSSPEISFRYIKAEWTKIESMLMSQTLSVDFLRAETNATTISLDPLPKTFKEICFVKSTVDIREAHIDFLEFTRCKFLMSSEISGYIKELSIKDCLNSNVFKLSLPQTEKLAFDGTINIGRLCISNFPSIIGTISNLSTDPTYDAQQLLMLKENFRQTGEYENEDICHLYYQRTITKNESDIIKKVGRKVLDWISGYGTKPFRMLLSIIVIIVLFGTLYYCCPTLSYHGVNTWIEHIYASGITFFAVGYGDLYPLNITTKMVSLVEAFLGVTATSYFLVLLSRKVIR